MAGQHNPGPLSHHTMNAIWFSRHTPTSEQLAEIIEKGYTLHRIEEGIALGARSVNSEEDAAALLKELRAAAREVDAVAVFGVFPTAIMSVAWQNAHGYMALAGDLWWGALSLYASINVQRSVEGGKPTFHHAKWVNVGVI